MRPATEQDEGGIAALAAIAGGSGWWGWEQRIGPDHPDRRRHVEVEGDRIVGYGCVWRRRGATFGLDTLVHPDHRKSGLGRRIVDKLFEDLADFGASGVEARIDADHTAALTFMARRGFFELGRIERTCLDVGRASSEETTPAGIAIAPLGARPDPDLMRELRGLVDAAFEEPPTRHRELFVESPFERFVADLDEAILDGCFLARDGESVVGMTGVEPGPEPRTLTAFMTAVLPAYRQRGIATALKQRTVAYARRHGYRAIFSNSPNRAMQDLNERLGFERCGASEIRMGRRL